MSPRAVRYKGEERTYVPEEIICLVLKHMVATAEKQLMGRRITQASVWCLSEGAGRTFAPLPASMRIRMQQLTVAMKLRRQPIED